jgi:hypothetical protein
MLISADGMYDRHGFDCWDCTERQQRGRGCGTKPVVHLADGRVSVWDVEQWDGKTDPQSLYGYARFGGLYEATGDPWPHCPRFFDPLAGFVPGETEVEALRLLDLASHLETQSLGLVHEGKLTPRERRLLGTAVAMRASVRKAKREREKSSNG